MITEIQIFARDIYETGKLTHTEYCSLSTDGKDMGVERNIESLATITLIDMPPDARITPLKTTTFAYIDSNYTIPRAVIQRPLSPDEWNRAIGQMSREIFTSKRLTEKFEHK
jgi:hypothetical protein